MIGGYKIIDFKGVPIKEYTETKAVIPGIYNRIEESYKMMVVENCVININSSNIELKPLAVLPIVTSSDYVFQHIYDEYILSVFVTDDDEVYYTVDEIHPEEP